MSLSKSQQLKIAEAKIRALHVIMRVLDLFQKDFSNTYVISDNNYDHHQKLLDFRCDSPDTYVKYHSINHLTRLDNDKLLGDLQYISIGIPSIDDVETTSFNAITRMASKMGDESIGDMFLEAIVSKGIAIVPDVIYIRCKYHYDNKSENKKYIYNVIHVQPLTPNAKKKAQEVLDKAISSTSLSSKKSEVAKLISQIKKEQPDFSVEEINEMIEDARLSGMVEENPMTGEVPR